ncbi:hypothetical protein JG688_00002311 [Phytophthora aleatoria]|uniref:Vacuolar protein sorting-associated protein 28 homolog n=1 Tax=Phytophthora aleatoria TaxID=2496075 RepID=A0A8J5J512_9STRA|nr:hypothetical protein JG688_00002311 [Phytophthora aleatoria]
MASSYSFGLAQPPSSSSVRSSDACIISLKKMPSSYLFPSRNSFTALQATYMAPPPPQQVREIKLWADTKDRRKYEDLSDLFAIFKTTEHLEAAYVRDAITPEEVESFRYTEACTKLISQYKTAETALRLGGFIDSVENFIAEYRLDCPRALERLVRIGVPATVVHNTTNRKTDSVNVAQTVQNFITLMDVLKLNIRAVDEIQPLLSEMMSSLTMVSGLPPDFAGRDKIEGWLRTMNAMRASDELDEEQARQLSFDLERAYSSFMAFLNK